MTTSARGKWFLFTILGIASRARSVSPRQVPCRCKVLVIGALLLLTCLLTSEARAAFPQYLFEQPFGGANLALSIYSQSTGSVDLRPILGTTTFTTPGGDTLTATFGASTLYTPTELDVSLGYTISISGPEYAYVSAYPTVSSGAFLIDDGESAGARQFVTTVFSGGAVAQLSPGDSAVVDFGGSTLGGVFPYTESSATGPQPLIMGSEATVSAYFTYPDGTLDTQSLGVGIFANADLTHYGGDGPSQIIVDPEATLTSSTGLGTVPEPATVTIWSVLGLAGVVCLRRRGSKGFPS